jgi:catechol 2,3-dioxygenase-like lactoylglutathione lyase family enzyme
MTSIVSSIAFVRLSAPDLGRMEEYLTDFGMAKVHRDDKRLYMRGLGDNPYLHVTELGEPGAIGQAYHVDDVDVLKDLVKKGMASAVEDLDGPGGGKRVRLADPDGCVVELVAGREKAAPLPNRAMVRAPDGASRIVGPARVMRIAHTACQALDVRKTIKWYQDTLGMIPTDELYVGTEDNTLGQFNRVDRGDELVDHHIIFIMRGKGFAGLHHASFEVETVDDIFFGNNHLEWAQSDHVRGIGRHALGSQIFDYWMSPFGQMHEHWSSSEKMVSNSGFNRIKIGEGMEHDTGEKPPERFTKQASPYLGWPAGA